VAEDVAGGRGAVRHRGHDAAVAEAAAPRVPDGGVKDRRTAGARGEEGQGGKAGQNGGGGARPREEDGQDASGREERQDLSEAEEEEHGDGGEGIFTRRVGARAGEVFGL